MQPGTKGCLPVINHLVDSVFQRFASFETRNLGGFDFDRSASLRVTAGTGSTFFHQESTETNQSNLITAFQCSANAVDHGVPCTTSSRFRDRSEEHTSELQSREKRECR